MCVLHVICLLVAFLLRFRIELEVESIYIKYLNSNLRQHTQHTKKSLCKFLYWTHFIHSSFLPLQNIFLHHTWMSQNDYDNKIVKLYEYALLSLALKPVICIKMRHTRWLFGSRVYHLLCCGNSTCMHELSFSQK